MSMSNTFETNLLNHIFTNAAITLVGDAAGLLGSGVAGSLYISLHTTPGPEETGNQSTNEATYTGYARKAVARSGAGWTISGNNASNAAAVTFDPCTAGSNTISHFGVGTDSAGTGKLIVWAALNATLAVSSGITPSFPIGDLDVNAD